MRQAEADSRLSSQQAAVMSERLREVEAAVQAAQAQLASHASAQTAEGERIRAGWRAGGVDAMTPLLLQVKEETLVTQQQVCHYCIATGRSTVRIINVYVMSHCA